MDRIYVAYGISVVALAILYLAGVWFFMRVAKRKERYRMERADQAIDSMRPGTWASDPLESDDFEGTELGRAIDHPDASELMARLAAIRRLQLEARERSGLYLRSTTDEE